MSSRIRYKNNGNELVSTKFYKSASGLREYGVKIELTTGKFVVFNSTDGDVAATAVGTSLAECKKKAKAALNNLGVLFEAETRAKQPEV